MFKLKMAANVILVSAIVMYGTWKFCQIGMAGAFFLMVCVPILFALWVARVIWASFQPGAKDQAQRMSEAMIGAAARLQAKVDTLDKQQECENDEWKAFTATDPCSIEAMAGIAPSPDIPDHH
ncbi:hypothetical protein KP003_14405 [Geomonas nitrogeniifigens]|uniref:hypothetical protein n=1 Tax=Geomonas diazotrophica TaxID=2843197 RepID=UPI001C2BA0A2|nr:hypothetical protein [Geomonas nitrogeniifigens]QXE85569.1 hypothetical protein KP003_14405 [Geomonas nitrogeniifigens]